MNQSERDIINDWLEGKVSDAELGQVLPAEEVRSYRQIINEVDSWKLPTENVPSLEEIRAQREAEVVPMYPSKWYLLVAASVVAVLIGVMVYLQEFKGDQVSAEEEIATVILPDGGSKVTLSKGSQVSWKDAEWTEEERVLALTGKGYFEVEKGGTFDVETALGSVQVLGTKFLIDQYQGGTAVTCYEGSVKATVGDSSVVMVAGEKYKFENGQWNHQSFEEKEGLEWMQGLTVLKDAPLSQVIATLVREFQLEVDTADVNTQRRFTGSFPNNDLDLALKIIFQPLQIKYELEEKHLTLKD